MTQELKNKLFKEFNHSLALYGISKPQDIFKLLNEFQSLHLENIENANNEKNRIALQRSIDYFDFDFLDRFKKFKPERQQKEIFKIVNSLCCQIPSINYINHSQAIKQKYDLCVTHKEHIIKQEDWYERVIPESNWLIENLKEL